VVVFQVIKESPFTITRKREQLQHSFIPFPNVVLMLPLQQEPRLDVIPSLAVRLSSGISTVSLGRIASASVVTTWRPRNSIRQTQWMNTLHRCLGKEIIWYLEEMNFGPSFGTPKSAEPKGTDLQNFIKIENDRNLLCSCHIKDNILVLVNPEKPSDALYHDIKRNTVIDVGNFIGWLTDSLSYMEYSAEMKMLILKRFSKEPVTLWTYSSVRRLHR
jgi:hypothetical protein